MHKIDNVIEKGKEMFQSLSNNESIDLEIFNSCIMELKQAIKSNPKLGKEIGPLIQKLITAKKINDKKSDIIQVPVLRGSLSIGHRPKIKEIPLLKRAGITHILTLLSKKEGGEKIGEIVHKWDLKWIWHPMENANPPDSSQYERYIQLFEKLQNILNLKGSIYIHCSAGIHRTGMIVFALLLYLGLNEQDAKELLFKLRVTTHENLGVERFEWGKELLKYKENQNQK